MIEFEPSYNASQILLSIINPNKNLKIDDEVRFVGSGKAGIGLILSYLSDRGIIKNKMEEVFVPPWMGTWVYSSMLPYVYPALSYNKSRIAWCYHQYGFPQNMDKFMDIAKDRDLIVIEDCAHAVDSYFDGKKVGSFGNFSIFSYSKFSFCYALGGVHGDDQEFMDYVEESIDSSPAYLRVLHNATKLLSTKEILHGKKSNFIKNMVEASYASYYRQPIPSGGGISMWLNNKELEIKKRKENYELLYSELHPYGLCESLEIGGITPYVLPLSVKNSFSSKVVNNLRAVNVQASVREFDINRCSFEPNYQSRIIIPLHSQVSKNDIDKMIETIKKSII